MATKQKKSTFDAIIVGCGIAGSSLSYELSKRFGLQVLVLEAESQPGYHSTGRSAALFSESYGPKGVRELTRGSREFLTNCPGRDFPKLDYPILAKRGMMWISTDPSVDHGLESIPGIKRLSKAETLQRCPVLKESTVLGSFLEEDAMDIDVAALQNGYISQAKAHNAQFEFNSSLENVKAIDDIWQVKTSTQDTPYQAKFLVNASGAWADNVNSIAGVGLGIKHTPMRRTMFTFKDPRFNDNMDWPFVVDTSVAVHNPENSFYFKPQSPSVFIASPADATPQEPADAYADDIEVAETVERLLNATSFNIERIDSNWAGLRTFTADGEFVLGENELEAPNYFHVTGLGGYGVQACPMTAMYVAELMVNKSVPKGFEDLEKLVSPTRFHSTE